MIKKCLVHGCVNHSNEGRFVGELCGPCHGMITSGKPGHGNTWIHKTVEQNEQLRDVLREIAQPAGVSVGPMRMMYKGWRKIAVERIDMARDALDYGEVKEMTRQYVNNKQYTSDGGSTQSYYGLPKGATDIADLIDYREMSFNIGNVFKACYRLGQKRGSSEEYDLRKIIYFATRELEKRTKAAKETDDLPSDVSLDQYMNRYD